MPSATANTGSLTTNASSLAVRTSPVSVEAPHLSVAISLTNLGSLLVYRGDYVAAQPLLSKSLEIRRRTLGNNHPDIARTLFNLAVLIEQIERWSEAEGYSREAESIWAALDYEDLYRQFNLNLLGGILTGQGRFAEAEPLLLQSYDSLQGVARLSPAQWSGIVARFVRLYEGWDLAEPGKGYGEKAAELRAKLEQLNTPQEPQSSTP